MRRFKRFKTGAAIVLALLAVAPQTAHAELARQAGTAYHVDTQSGNDSASGLDSAHAWRTLARVNSTVFQPGDRILLRAGSRWTGQLWPKGSGTSTAPITIDRYGTGAAPRVDGGGQVADAVRLANQQFWTIRGLEVTNQVPATGTPGQNRMRSGSPTIDSGTRIDNPGGRDFAGGPLYQGKPDIGAFERTL
ncbi:hypothetical protein [Lentzea atacamensis]|uniref:hypothetical protein n=1 Tax=Lentzea atacamensis TaxID=531938 RepID=UPI001F1BC82C|nr:hypothetical protein [Lentzea atacamensis]